MGSFLAAQESRRSPLNHLIALERIANRIIVLRGQKVILSSDLAVLYQVEPRALIQAVRRNPDRFPADFMFALTKDEFARLRSQIVISNARRGGHRYAPLAFTEHGIAMLSSVLRSERAVQVNIAIMRTFTHLRKWHLTTRSSRGH
jgi:hypothetical protein